MGVVIAWVNGNKVKAAGIATVVIGWLGPIGVPSFVVAGLLTILGILSGTAVAGAVTTNEHAAAAVTEAASTAARHAVEAVGTETAGASGELTGAGMNVASEVAHLTAKSVLRKAGIPSSAPAA